MYWHLISLLCFFLLFPTKSNGNISAQREASDSITHQKTVAAPVAKKRGVLNRLLSSPMKALKQKKAAEQIDNYSLIALILAGVVVLLGFLVSPFVFLLGIASAVFGILAVRREGWTFWSTLAVVIGSIVALGVLI